MTEKTLKTAFEQLELRPPSPAAEDRAIEAGLAAFRLSRQKSGARRRPMSDVFLRTWELIMGHRMAFGSAVAGILAVVVVVGVAQHRLGNSAMDASLVTAANDVVRQRQQVLLEPDTADLSSPTEEVAPTSGFADLQVAGSPTGELAESADDEGFRLGVASQLAAAPPMAAPSPTIVGVAKNNLAPDMSPPRPHLPLARSIEPGDNRYRPAAEVNELRLVSEAPVSTFSIDVDTAAYAQVRRMLNQGILPAPADVRVEEMINYFSYDYPLPEDGDAPFRPSVAIYPTPWNADTKLLHVGIKGKDIARASRPHANLVFLIDTSGSMEGPDRLPLLKTAFRMLLDTLDGDDTVAIVTYAGDAGTVLEPTSVREKRKILSAITNLRPGGSTAGAAGIAEAYALAEEAFDKNGVNRVILATDGDFNVGITDIDQLKRYIAEKRKSGVFLSVLGFGEGNYNDALMQVLAQNGNGNAAYIDTLKEAEKVLVNEATSTLFPIAKDVKIQIEFNPANVSAYRLIGYETRMLRRQDFNDDRIDAGEIGSGHTVTAIYEIVPAGAANQPVDDLRYARPAQPVIASSDEYALLKLRYKAPHSDRSELIEFPVTRDLEKASIEAADADMRFAAAVAAFGQKLRGETDLEGYSYRDIQALAASARGDDPFGLRAEMAELVRLAGYLAPTEVENSDSGGR